MDILLMLATNSDAQSKIIEKTPEYWAPIFTLIVGILGIISQITINYLLEKRKLMMEDNKIKKENIQNYYIPLIVLIRKYKYYREILLKIPDFRIGWHSIDNEYDRNTYQDFVKIYEEIFVTLQKGYIPMNKELDIEIDNFFEHVIIAQNIFQNSIEKQMIESLLGKNYMQGYDCGRIEQLLRKEIIS